MTALHWFRQGVLAATVFATAAVSLRAQIPEPPRTESPEQSAQRDLAQQAVILTDVASKPEQRDQAAERLVARQRLDARDILLNALRDAGNRPAQIAVARALAADGKPDPRAMQPLIDLLGRDPQSSEAAAQALVNFGDNPQVLKSLIDFAGDGRQLVSSRVVVIRAIGSFVNKTAAAFLIGVINNGGEDSKVRKEADAALVEMTGLAQLEGDVRQWNAWWDGSSKQPDAQWEAAQFRSRATRYAHVKLELRRLSDRIKSLLQNDYLRAPENQRAEMVLGWLMDKEPAVKVVAARIIQDQTEEALQLPPAVVEQLRKTIGDSSPEVRLEVVRALRDINDPGSVDALLAQLAIESDADVKVVIAQTPAVLKQAKSIDPLLRLLDDPSTRVAEAGARALAAAELGKLIRDDPVMTSKVSAKLREKLFQVRDIPGTEELRASLLEALAQTHDQSQLDTFMSALESRNPVRIRIAASKGLGNMTGQGAKEQAAASLVAALRNDPERGVRLEAVKSLGNVGTFDQAEALYERMGRNEPDKTVQSAAWNVLSTFFSRPEATVDQLVWWAERFKSEPDRRLVVLRAQRDKLVNDALNPKAAQMLAGVQQNIGEVLASLKEPQWDEAVASLRAAMDYQTTHGAPGNVIAQLGEQLIVALLRSEKYAEAMQFAAARIAAAADEQQTMGYRIVSEVKRLTAAGDNKKALQLLREAAKIPLRGPYEIQLKKYRDDLEAVQ